MQLNAPVSTLMTTAVECVTPEQKLIDVKHIYEKSEFHSHIPVTENGKIVGIISLINFMRAIHNATLDDSEKVYHEITVRDIMTPNPKSVSPKTTIKETASILAKGNFHSVLVVTDNKIDGIVTTTDILKNLIKD